MIASKIKNKYLSIPFPCCLNDIKYSSCKALLRKQTVTTVVIVTNLCNSSSLQQVYKMCNYLHLTVAILLGWLRPIQNPVLHLEILPELDLQMPCIKSKSGISIKDNTPYSQRTVSLGFVAFLHRLSPLTTKRFSSTDLTFLKSTISMNLLFAEAPINLITSSSGNRIPIRKLNAVFFSRETQLRNML